MKILFWCNLQKYYTAKIPSLVYGNFLKFFAFQKILIYVVHTFLCLIPKFLTPQNFAIVVDPLQLGRTI